MNRKLILIGFILFVLVVAIFAFFLKGKTNNENAVPVVKGEKAELVLLENGSYQITYPVSNINLEIPEEWSPIAFNDIERGVAFGTSDSDGNTVTGFFASFRDPNLFSIESFKKENPGYWFEVSENGGAKTLYYLGNGNPPFTYDSGDDAEFSSPETDRGDTVVLSNNYATGKLIISKNSAVRIDCQLSGPSYSKYISLCNSVVDSLKVNP
mgnify:CR=1 FL=1